MAGSTGIGGNCCECGPACPVPLRDLTLTLIWYDTEPADAWPPTECRRRTLKLRMHFDARSPGFTVNYGGPSNPDATGALYGHGQVEAYTSSDGNLWYTDAVSVAPRSPAIRQEDIVGFYPGIALLVAPGVTTPTMGWRFLLFNDATGTFGTPGYILLGFRYFDITSPGSGNTDPPAIPYQWVIFNLDGVTTPPTPTGAPVGFLADSAYFGNITLNACDPSPFLLTYFGTSGSDGFQQADDASCAAIGTAFNDPVANSIRWFSALFISEPDYDPDQPCSVCFSARCCADDCPDATILVYPSHDGTNTGTPIASGTIPAGKELCLSLPIAADATERRHDVVVSATGFGSVSRTITFDLGVCSAHTLYSFDLVKSTYSPTFYVFGAKATCPVEGAIVAWATDNGSFSDTTDADGLVSFPDISPPPANTAGTLTITPPTGCGWDTYVESFTLSPEYLCDPNRIDRQLPPAISYTYAGGVCTRPLKTVTTLVDSNGLVASLTYFGFDAGTSTALWTACASYTGGPVFGPVTCGDDSKSYASALDDVPVGYTLQITGGCDSGPPTWTLTKQAWKTNASCTGDVSKLVGRVWKLPLGIILDIACSDGLVTAPAGSDSSTELAEAEASGTFDCSCGATTTDTLTGVGVGSPPSAFLGDVSFDL